MPQLSKDQELDSKKRNTPHWTRDSSGNFLDTTVDEWKAEIYEWEKYASGNDPGSTIKEIARVTGVSRYMIAKRVKELITSGRCEQGTGTRVDISGRRQRVTVYSLLPKET